MNLKLLILPDDDLKADLELNIHNSRFVWNKVLERYNNLYKLFKQHGYPLYPNIKKFKCNFNDVKKRIFLFKGW